MPTRTYETENKKFVIDAITNTYNIDPNKISIKSQWGWNFILFGGDEQQNWNNSLIEHKFREYEICHFTEDAEKIIIHLNKYSFEDAGLGRISKESAQVIANEIKERSRTNKEIYVYRETSEGLDEFDGYAERLLYPEKKSFLKRIFRRE